MVRHSLVTAVLVTIAAAATNKSPGTQSPTDTTPKPKPTTPKSKSGGLPGMTPTKKAALSASAMSTPNYFLFRTKLQEAFCPTASDEYKASVACKSWSITKQMRSASSADERKKFEEQRKKIFESEGKKSEDAKKAASAKAKVLYTKAYAKFCIGTRLLTEETCTNALMKKMYGPKAKDGLR
mmetsp:Transcript_71161/g.141099  ORF Transcript_71161/g.141099 Transcript_71161/m.141099 type:complete len:182 (-) Transcript_71161:369-914(-)